MRKLVIISTLIVLQSCAHSRFVEPLNKGELSIGGSLGGPSIEFAGAPVPLPLSSIEVGYGVDTSFTVFTAWHTTAALFGNFQLDFGLTYQFLEQDKFRPNVSVSPSFNYIVSIAEKDQRFWPILDVNAFWNYGNRSNYWYLGINNYFELKQNSANEQSQKHHWIFSPQIGHVVKGKKRPWRLTTEFKFIAPNLNNVAAFVPYKSVFGQWGSTGFYIGFSYPINVLK